MLLGGTVPSYGNIGNLEDIFIFNKSPNITVDSVSDTRNVAGVHTFRAEEETEWYTRFSVGLTVN